MIVTLTKDLRILDLFLRSVEDQSQVIAGIDDSKILTVYKQYDCQIIKVNEIYNDPFLSLFTTFKKCILINHLIEKGHRNFLFCDDDCIILKSVNLEKTRVRSAITVDFTQIPIGKIFDQKRLRYESGHFVLNLSENEAQLYIDTFYQFVALMREHAYLFFPQEEDNFKLVRECAFNMWVIDGVFLNQFFDQISKIEDYGMALTLTDIKAKRLSCFELYLKQHELDCPILHFDTPVDKNKFMQLFYDIKTTKG